MTSGILTRNFTSLYISDLLGKRVFSVSGEPIGRVKDLVIQNDPRPRIMACVLKKRRGQAATLQWDQFTIDEEDHQLELICHKQSEFAVPENAIYLSRQVLDRQIVDVDDRKLVRVNDIRLAFLPSGTFPVAVDVGTMGLLRRLGAVELATWILKLFNASLRSRLILWNNIELLSFHARSIKLSVTQSRVLTLRPSELSDIIEDLDTRTGTALFQALDHEKAADVLEEMEDEAKLNLVEDLPLERAADVLEKMPADEVADILSELKEEKAKEILQEMDQETSREVRELMDYPEDTAGTLMSTDFLAFPATTTAGTVVTEIQRTKPEADSLHSIYVLDQGERLIGEITLRDLILSDPQTPISSFMNRNPISILDMEPVSELTRLISKYTLLAVPVVNDQKKLVGNIVIDDIVHEIFKNRKVTL